MMGLVSARLGILGEQGYENSHRERSSDGELRHAGRSISCG